MLTLTYGHKKPQTGDKGDVFFPALEDNIDIDDSHTHNGLNSAPIDSSNITKAEVSVTNSGWAASGDLYRKAVNFPGTYTNSNSLLRFIVDGGTYDGVECYPKVEYLGATQIYLYSPVNNQAFKVLFV